MLETKENKLQNILANYNKVVVGFSGGIDSTVVLKEAMDVLGKDNVLAVVANSELFSDDEYNKAIDLAHELGANVKGIELDYLVNDQIANNTPDSWYQMKTMFYQALKQIALNFDHANVLDGMIMDDNNDFRPGLRARDELGAISVLQMADFYKKDVRELAHRLGLNNWNKVASCSVSSRFPYNTKLTSAKLQQVINAEKVLRQAGFPVVRVRVHDKLARIEVPVDQISDLLKQRSELISELKELGYEFVTIDLNGFVSGRMNEVLSEAEKVRALEG